MITVQYPTLQDYIKLMADGRLKLARYGDGEWHCILNHPGQNCDGHTYFPEMGAELREAIGSENHIHGHLTVARLAGVPSVTRYIRDHSLGELTWHNGGLLADESMAGRLRPFVEALREQRTMFYVGPQHLFKITNLVKSVKVFTAVPKTNAWLERGRIEAELRHNIRLNKSLTTIGFSAGPLSKILIYALARDFPHLNLIDFGSMWDGYFGHMSRSYLRHANYEQLTAVNFGVNP